MAKSLRSKHKRRMRAIKRIRYGEKELNRLKEMINKTEKREKQFTHSMETDATVMQFEKNTAQNFTKMETVNDETRSLPRNRTLLDKNGQYPTWMNGRRLKKQKALVKRLKSNKKKQMKKNK